MAAAHPGQEALREEGFTQALAGRTARLGLTDIPDDVIAIARQALVDWFAVTLGGSVQEGPKTLLEVLLAGRPEPGSGATVVGHRPRLAALDAALVNGASSHALDFDDVNLALPGHVSVAVLAAVLALGEERDSAISDLLVAFVAGYEAAGTIAVAVGGEPYVRGFHTTGVTGTFGAASACARLLGLDREQTARAIGIAASEAAGLKCNFGTMTKSLHAGRACQSGLLAAALAQRGFTASRSALEVSQGFAAAVAGHRELPSTATVEGHWHLRENLFKHHAACFFTHSAIEGLRELAEAGPISIDEIERVTLHVTPRELDACAIPTPATALEVKFSLAHLAAMALLGRPTDVIADADASDREVIAVRAKVVMLADGDPERPTLVEVAMRDGTSLTIAREVNGPERDLALQGRRLEDKFISLARPVLGGAAARRLLDLLGHLQGSHHVRELMELARP